jgi:hypothetical protein
MSLNCPRCNEKNFTHQTLSLHLQFSHPEFWNKVEKTGRKLQKLGAVGTDTLMEKEKRLEKLRGYYDKSPEARDRMDTGKFVDILEERDKNTKYIAMGEKVRPLKPIQADRLRIIKSK